MLKWALDRGPRIAQPSLFMRNAMQNVPHFILRKSNEQAINGSVTLKPAAGIHMHSSVRSKRLSPKIRFATTTQLRPWLARSGHITAFVFSMCNMLQDMSKRLVKCRRPALKA